MIDHGAMGRLQMHWRRCCFLLNRVVLWLCYGCGDMRRGRWPGIVLDAKGMYIIMAHDGSRPTNVWYNVPDALKRTLSNNVYSK